LRLKDEKPRDSSIRRKRRGDANRPEVTALAEIRLVFFSLVNKCLIIHDFVGSPSFPAEACSGRPRQPWTGMADALYGARLVGQYAASEVLALRQ
jgi:hypothetical protein